MRSTVGVVRHTHDQSVRLPFIDMLGDGRPTYLARAVDGTLRLGLTDDARSIGHAGTL